MKVNAMIVATVLGASGCMMPMMCGMKHDGGDHSSHGATSEAVSRTGTGAGAPTAPVAEVWKCPMGHVTASAPGKCPTCGMDLVKEAAK